MRVVGKKEAFDYDTSLFANKTKKENPRIKVQKTAGSRWECSEKLLFQASEPAQRSGKEEIIKRVCESKKKEGAQEIDICQ